MSAALPITTPQDSGDVMMADVEDVAGDPAAGISAG
jgi:hypothetical protein